VLNSSALQKLLSLKPFEFLGKISFSMYVFHLPVVMSVGSWIMVYSYGSYGKVVASALAIIASIVVTLIISKLGYVLIDIPSQKWAKKVTKKVIS
jgi:peptidoglycan/LPS O-acetylase OafA/YrhL